MNKMWVGNFWHGNVCYFLENRYSYRNFEIHIFPIACFATLGSDFKVNIAIFVKYDFL